MAGYWLVRGGEIRDEAALQQYADHWPSVATRYGAEIVAGKGAIDTREGPHYPRQLVVRFETYEQALACYNDPEYQRIKAFVEKAYDRELSILEG
ncbi:MAG: DUF1330 domain-containing protein [Pseudomonadota bacterium]